MPIYTPSGFLDITNATLRTSNIESQNINFTGSGGSISVGPAFDFQQVSAIGNTTPETIQFTNATTSFVTSGNVEVGKNISVVDATVSSNMSVGGNVTVSSNLSVSGNVTIGKNLFLTSNTTTSINSNVIVEHSGPHPREPTTPLLKKFPEIDFDASKMDGNDTANTYVQAGYVVTASSQSSGSEVWRLFDDGDWNQEAIVKYPSFTFQYNPTSNPNSLGDVSGEWFKVKFPRKVIINKFTLNVGDSINNGLVAFKVLGSDDDTNWTEVKDVSGLTSASYTTAAPFVTTVESVSSVAYRYYAVVITRLLGVNQVSIREVEFYGYEEDLPAGDTSLDTTFTSILNRPQTGGVKVYVDGNLGETLTNRVTGPIPTGTDATYDSTGKYWELTGALTSNVTLEANTFLEGDAPHSVSMWFNSSNLEANVSNTCVFSVSDQEHLNSQNLDLQSNTWHNLTYSYQGEGGSRVTYLDGRKVSEDQAEDTFGEYPPFAMTGYSQGGYVVSASSEASASWQAWEAFDKQDIDTSAWLSSAGGYPNTSGNATSGRNLGTSSGGSATADGDWLKIELPHKIRLNYITMTGYNNVGVDDFDVVATNDDTNWEVLLSDTLPSAAYNVPYSFVIPSSVYYKYYAIIVKSHRGTVHPYTGIYELRLYGHRENDLVRLPDPTRVLKYPHIAMTGPAQRGYVTSSSGGYATTPDKAFDGNYEALGGNWLSTAGTFSGGFAQSVETFNGSGSVVNGPWLKIEMSRKILPTKLDMFVRESGNSNPRQPRSGVIYGSTDNSSWTNLGSFSYANTTLTGASTANEITLTPSPSGTHYKYFLLHVTQMMTAKGLSDRVSITGLEFYGTEEASSVPIQIGGGNIDRVANFRVYDKFLEEDQALEIWDAQKDTFRGVKNSMTLHKGRLGIGTTEPEGRLAVLDEPHNLEEFPPRAMTAGETYMEGHGVFTAWGTNESGIWPEYQAFDDTSLVWYSDSLGEYNNGDYAGTKQLAPETAKGAYVVLEMPYEIVIKQTKFWRQLNGSHVWDRGIYYAKCNPSDEWTAIHNVTGKPANDHTPYIAYITDPRPYKYFAIVITRRYGTTAADGVSIREFQIFGTREQRQSVLHDGQLTLTKNLDVPRIGPPLDADDTPRRDRLVVEYNTSSNPTFEGAVRDTSGRGNDGVLLESARYDASDKAFVFDGAGGPIERRDFREFKGNQPFTASMWFKKDDDHWGTLLSIAPTSGEAADSCIILTVALASSGRSFDYQFFGSDYRYNPTVNPGSWHHVAITYSGGTVGSDHFNDRGGRDLYFDGVLITPASETVDTGDVLNLPNNPVLRIGERVNSANHFEGSISNFKLYDTALAASEVKTLYDMGRNGSVANPQPLHIAAPLYAPGVPVQIVSKVYKKQASYGSTSSYRNIKELDISIKPKFANSKILLHWMINGELHQDNVIRVARDGSYIIHGYNETEGTSRWSGIAAGGYDNNQSSTPENYCIDTYDEPGGTNTYNYQIYIGSSSTTSYPAYINRTYDRAGADAYEAGICFMSATEIAQ